MVATINDLRVGEGGTVTGYVGDDHGTVNRLIELGVVVGERVVMTRKALFGNPMAVEVRGAVIGMGLDEAATVTIKRGGMRP
jgi:Fe2+ transport system protein FeoA